MRRTENNRAMNTIPTTFIALLAAAIIVIPSFAQGQTTPAAPTASPSTASGTQMSNAETDAKMMELSKLNENHKLLASLAGTWSYTNKMWMNPDPKVPPSESKGSAVRKPFMDGRYFIVDFKGQFEMPGADGKMKSMEFRGHSLEGYDNVKQKFVGTWVDNMGTGVMYSEGTYDPATKTFTYYGENEIIPGMKQKVREVIKVIDKNHHTMEYYENRGGQEAKIMEINYTRKK